MISKFSRSVSLLTLSFLLSPLSDFQAMARWMEEDEANVECLHSKVTYKIQKDGTWTMETEEQFKILTDAGRQAFKTKTFKYNAVHNTIEVLEAKTSNNDTDHIVPKEKIEDKDLASGRLGLSQKRQILVPFECVQTGSIIHLKTKTSVWKPQIESYFSQALTFNDGCLWKNYTAHIESELPLFTKINDPRNCLTFRESQDESKYTVDITLNKPILEQLVNEPETSVGELPLYTSIAISTEKDYERFGKIEGEFYQPVLTESLPPKLAAIRKNAKTITDETECIDTIVSQLIDNITYLGSWDTDSGALAPRSLEAIINSGYGDCKEYSSCLAAILNKLGFQAKIANVYRSEAYVEEETRLPGLNQFNHIIVKVIGPSGKTYWVDPTNQVSMADGIFSDIADRPVLVLDPEIPTYERTPPINYQHSISQINRVISITEGGSIKTEGTFYNEGETAKELTEHLSQYPASSLKEPYIKAFCQGHDPLNSFINFPEGTSRIVRPLRCTFGYEENNTMIHTNLGDAFPLLGQWHESYIVHSQTDEGALFVGNPETVIKTLLIKNVSGEKLERLAFSVQTPWVNAKRELVQTEEGILVTETIEKLKSLIPAKDLKSKEYGDLVNTLRKYCDGVAILFSN